MARKRRRNEEAPGWVWMLFGLAIGLIIALGVYVNGRPNVTENAPIARIEEAPVVTEAAPVEPPTQTIETAAENPDRFSFYDLLPQFEVIVPEIEQAAPRTNPTVAINEPGTYVLQAGSFLTAEDAESQRARLALLGIESRLQRVSIDDRTFHRVRIGPISDLDTLNSIRSRLLDAEVESLVMRMAG